jgi:hypothetical protein
MGFRQSVSYEVQLILSRWTLLSIIDPLANWPEQAILYKNTEQGCSKMRFPLLYRFLVIGFITVGIAGCSTSGQWTSPHWGSSNWNPGNWHVGISDAEDYPANPELAATETGLPSQSVQPASIDGTATGANALASAGSSTGYPNSYPVASSGSTTGGIAPAFNGSQSMAQTTAAAGTIAPQTTPYGVNNPYATATATNAYPTATAANTNQYQSTAATGTANSYSSAPVTQTPYPAYASSASQQNAISPPNPSLIERYKNDPNSRYYQPPTAANSASSTTSWTPPTTPAYTPPAIASGGGGAGSYGGDAPLVASNPYANMSSPNTAVPNTATQSYPSSTGAYPSASPTQAYPTNVAPATVPTNSTPTWQPGSTSSYDPQASNSTSTVSPIQTETGTAQSIIPAAYNEPVTGNNLY